MHPTLGEIFGQPIPAYFTLLLIGFAVATWLGASLAKRMDLSADTFVDLGLFSVLFGVLGARLMHVLADGYFWDYVHLCTDPSQVAWQIPKSQCEQLNGLWLEASQRCQPTERDCFAWAAFWRGGLAYYGGLLAAGVFGIAFLKREGFPLRRGLDIASISICVGLFFGRMGCFLAGCCFGVHTERSFALRFPPFSPASESQWRAGLLSAPNLPSLPVHPTQLYEALGCLLLAAFLMLLLRPRKRFDGQVMLVFVAVYAVLRFVLELWRADDRGEIMGLSSSQALGIPALLIVLVLWLHWRPAKPGA